MARYLPELFTTRTTVKTTEGVLPFGTASKRGSSGIAFGVLPVCQPA